MSIKNSNSNYIIMSAERANLSIRENIQRTEELQDVLESNGLNYVRAFGRWDRTNEVSLIVKLNDYRNDLNFVMNIAKEFEQDAILEVKQGHGWLHMSNGTEQFIGTMHILPNPRGLGEYPRDNYTELNDGTRFRFTK